MVSYTFVCCIWFETAFFFSVVPLNVSGGCQSSSRVGLKLGAWNLWKRRSKSKAFRGIRQFSPRKRSTWYLRDVSTRGHECSRTSAVSTNDVDSYSPRFLRNWLFGHRWRSRTTFPSILEKRSSRLAQTFTIFRNLGPFRFFKLLARTVEF